MTFDDKKIGTLIVAIPVFHLLSATLYLWAYSNGFGSHLIAFASSADIFSTSVNDMVRVYAIALVIPFLMNFYKYMPTYKPPTISAEATVFGMDLKRTTTVLFIFMGVAFLALQAYIVLIEHRHVEWFLFLLAAQLFVGLWSFRFGDKHNLSRLGRDVIYFLPMFFLSALFLGLDNGSIDRRRDYKDSKSSFAACGNMLVIRHFGEGFIAIRPSGRKVAIDKDCRILFKFRMVPSDNLARS